MKKKWRPAVTLALSLSMLTASGAAAAPAEVDVTGVSVFEREFMSPPEESEPILRWWIAPGRMTEESIDKSLKSIAEGGFSAVELQSLEMAKNCVLNDETWNSDMKKIMKAGKKYGIRIDFTVGQLWPVATPEITDPDDVRCEWQIFEKKTDFSAESEGDRYHSDAPEYDVGGVDPDRPWISTPGLDDNRRKVFIAAVAVKKDGENYDPSSARLITTDDGPVDFEAPEAGEWTIFTYYAQTANHTTMVVNQQVIDHMSEEGTRAVIDNWENAMDNDPELRRLYESNTGNIFGDSFELRSDLWTPQMLEEFRDRRGYELITLLPALKNDMGLSTNRIREDFYATETELMSEHHMRALQDWAHTHNMELRYQAYSSAGSSDFEMTYPALNIDVVEAEAYAMSGTVPDSYRQLSGVVHMKNDTYYTAETGEVGNDSWRATWTDTRNSDGERNNKGLFYYANRLFAGGVNKLTFHGATAKFTDMSGLYGDPQLTWPGFSAMAGMGYGNEWDDKTPMWENIDITNTALSRYQYVLQQGRADMDIAVYRSLWGKGNIRDEMTDLEKKGFTYDYVTPTILNMDEAETGEEDGRTVLAPGGPSYKALIIEPLNDGTVPSMPVETAEQILRFARNGLPVIIIGEAPSRANSCPGSDPDSRALSGEEDHELQSLMDELENEDSVIRAGDRAEAADALIQMGVTPDGSYTGNASVYFQHRKDGGNDFYFAYNDSSSDVYNGCITLKGEGIPYILDPWSGKVKKVAQYKRNTDDNSIAVDTELRPESSVLYGLLEPGYVNDNSNEDLSVRNVEDGWAEYYNGKVLIKSDKGGTVNVEREDGSEEEIVLKDVGTGTVSGEWTMYLNKWVHDESSGDPVATRIERSDTFTLSGNDMKPWREIDGSLERAAGTAVYSTEFDLERGWKDGGGAILSFTRMSDTGRLFVNGSEVPFDEISLKTDIGPWLRSGKNEIEVRVVSNMSNAIYGTIEENHNPWSGQTTTVNNQFEFGIIGGVSLKPYSYISIDGEETGNGEIVDTGIPKEGRMVSASVTGQIKIGGTPYDVRYNETALSYTGSSLSKLLKNVIVFTDKDGNKKEIKSVKARAKKTGNVVITKIVFTDGTVLKKADLKELTVKISPREVSANSAENENGAVVYARLTEAKLNRSGKKMTVRVELPNWDKNAKDASKESLNKKKPFRKKKLGKKDFDFYRNGDSITIRFKNNYTGSITVKQ